MSEDVLDLDELAPPSVTIKLAGKEISVAPPKTGELLKLGSLSRNLANVDSLTEDQLNTKVGELTSQVYKMIPELDGQTLYLAQLQSIVSMFTDMATPKDMKALKANGITPKDASKTPSN